MAEAARLTGEHAALLADLEKTFPETMHQGEERLRRKLELLARSEKSSSWLLTQRGEFVAYLISWLTYTRLDRTPPDLVILIDCLQIAPGHPTALMQLLTVFGNDLAKRGLGKYPIEGVCRRNAYKTFMDHQGVVRRLGYELAGTYEYWDEDLGEEMCWMRWHPAGYEASMTQVRDAADISHEALEEELESDDQRSSLFRLFQ
ncbi:MAG: hypothetical protein ACYCW6_26105 [Candidatus Xenobia bacterium]